MCVAGGGNHKIKDIVPPFLFTWSTYCQRTDYVTGPQTLMGGTFLPHLTKPLSYYSLSFIPYSPIQMHFFLLPVHLAE